MSLPAVALLVSCASERTTRIDEPRVELSSIDGKPLNAALMRNLRSQAACGFSIPDKDGGIRSIVLRGSQLPFRLPALATADNGQKPNGRAVRFSIKNNHMGETVTVACWVPDWMSVSDLASMVDVPDFWEVMYLRLIHGAKISSSLLAQPISREAQQLRFERINPNPSPLSLSGGQGHSGAGQNAAAECGHGQQGPNRPFFSTALACSCFQDTSNGIWYCTLYIGGADVALTGYETTDDGLFMECDGDGCSGGSYYEDPNEETSDSGLPCTPNLFNWNNCRKNLTAHDSSVLAQAIVHKDYLNQAITDTAVANLCKHLYNELNVAFFTDGYKMFKKGSADLPDGGAGPHVGYWDGAYIHLDERFLSQASGRALVLALMHEMAHSLGYPPHGDHPGGDYTEPPYKYLRFNYQGADPSNPYDSCVP